MESVLNFLLENWKIIVVVAAIIISAILSLFKKNKVNIVETSVLIDCLKLLPDFINSAEAHYGKGHGKEKFKMVLAQAVSYISECSNIDVSSVITMYGKILSEQINKTLTTPQSHGYK